MQLATTTSRLLQPTTSKAAAVWKPVAVRAMSSGAAPSVPPDADIKAAREAEPQYHGSGGPLDPKDTAAGRATEDGPPHDKHTTQPTAAGKQPDGGQNGSGIVNPTGFDTTAATDPEGGSFRDTPPSPGLPSTGSPTRGFSHD